MIVLYDAFHKSM